jgi:hypothetical protein
VLIPKVAADIAIMVADASRRVFTVLKQLFEAIKRISFLTKRCEGILAPIGQANRDTLRLQAFRVQAAIESGPGWSGFKQASSTIGQGHTSVYGPMQDVIVNTARSASQTNGAQNSGQAGDTLRGDNPTPTPIQLPL